MTDQPEVRAKKIGVISNLVIYLLNTFVNKVPLHFVRLAIYRLIYPIGRGSVVLLNVRFFGSRVRIGDNVIVNSFATLDGRGAPLTIKDGADIGAYVRIWTLEHAPNSPTFATRAGAVTIGKDAWIVSGSTILPGITIGDGAVVASGSVVTRDVPPMTIFAGNPAKQIGMRQCVPIGVKKRRAMFE